MKKVRCAIYTRKSSEEGLEQEFNSLDAQREACESYIASQKHEGWVLLPNRYDDGGISGGTLDRAGLHQLMHDVDEGLVDQIVVYKIDRLTRSLSDFAKLVDRLDAADASFVSVTQSFNTATSMGRLTLNVLLSFAQFEREVTAERIRDKIAASKKKGLWMGGNVPLGYDPDGRTLKINLHEVETVKTIYNLYQIHGTIRTTVAQAKSLELRSKDRDVDGIQEQGPLLSRGPIYYILTNPVYAGKIRHKDKIHEGQHPAIVEPDVWDKVQKKLSEDAARKRRTTTSIGSISSGARRSLLAGKLFDETGDRLTPSHANKKGKRYRYYVSSRLIDTIKLSDDKNQADGPKKTGGWRLPAKPLEQQIATSIVDHVESQLANDLFIELDVEKIELTHAKLNVIRLAMKARQQCELLDSLKKATIKTGSIMIELDTVLLADQFDLEAKDLNPDVCTFETAFQRKKRGVESKLVIGNRPNKETDQVLIDNISRAHQFYDAIKQGQTFDLVAASNKMTKRRLLQIIDLAFLAPDITKSILAGSHTAGLTTKWLEKNPLPAA